MRRAPAAAVALALLAAPAFAQFTGPSTRGQEITVAQVADARIGSYVTVTGNILSHQRENYYLFADATGQIRAEIAHRVWGGREVTASTPVRLLAEVSRGFRGRYLWVESLDVVE
ncbi:YgiW/YdeI family stress tolerance OB fold protein [Amaricoccus sp.]|uniref:YgiW/YdeI family stress tolerance OB fold protein n=1 Tax=Amaricoccus sp. TaxID=1872485 RepID=UPI00262F6512|nr:NirD/YgiW/YdeI family stress tolerance protein [Amaricoccus sp.]HRO12081.1 NirD/YgiW/YdeI family stress tolerance protein [Amaricoccus sp.]